MMPSLNQIAAALGGKVCGRQVIAPGPGHRAHDKSLSVKINDTGDDFVVNSFAGDDPVECKDYIRDKLGMPAWQPSKGNGHAPPPAPSAEIAARRAAATARAAAVLTKGTEPATKVVATYDYVAANGTLLYQVLRYEPKNFRQRRPDGNDFVWGLGDTARVLYRLRDLADHPCATVFICEGEKDADRLTALQLCATTISGGTRWAPDIAEPLRGRDVVILPDYDAAGAKKALEAANALHEIAASIRIAVLPGLTGPPENKDVSDWLDADPARADILATICLAAPLWSPQIEIEGLAAAATIEPTANVTDPLGQDGEEAPLGEWDAGDDDQPIPPRGWLLGTTFCRRFVSALIAGGGAGKTALRYAQLLSLATDRELTGEHGFQRCRVLIVSLEDDTDELRRRLKAAMLHHGINRSDVKGWLFVVAPGRAGGKIMETDEHGRPAIGALARRLTRTIINRRIDIVALDPFVKSYGIPENDNNLIDGVVQVLSELAAKHDIAVDTPHHVSKGPADPGNADRGRGASSAKDAWRLVYTLSVMSPEEAQALGLGEADRRYLIRVDSAKINIAPPLTEAKWFRLISVNIGNGAGIYPNGDDVQTVEPWSPPDTFAGLNDLMLNQILNDIDAGLPDSNRYTDAPNVIERAAWRVVEKHCPGKSEAACRQIIKLWVKSGLLIRRTYENKVTRKPAIGLWVDNGKRPS